MPTQTSQLVSNLQTIYNTKLEIKAALGTNSDDFTQYPSLIEAAIEGGGGGSSVDPWYNSTDVLSMIGNEETTADSVYTNLDENFSVTMDSNEESIEAVEWDFYMEVPTGELGQDDNPIAEQKKFHVIVSSNDEHGELPIATDIEAALEDYPDLYGFIWPILENATLTESADPSEDGYDYLLEGDIYAWNLNNCCGEVQEITENGFYPSDGALGFNVNIEGTIVQDAEYYFFNWLEFGATNANTLDFDNPGAGTIYIMNLDPINYTDNGVDTQNDYSEIELSKYSNFNSVVQFNTLHSGTDDNNYQYYGFNDLSTGSSPQFKYIRATRYTWTYDFGTIDPETGEHPADWEAAYVLTGTFLNIDNNGDPYLITDNDEVVISTHYNTQNNEWEASLYINGMKTEDITLTAVQ